MAGENKKEALGFSGGAMIAAVAGMAVCATFLVFLFLGQKGLETDVFADAGTFFSFAYGVPITLFGAMFAFVAARVTSRIQGRQGDLEILQFIEDKCAATVSLQKDVTVALADSVALGREARTTGKHLLAMLGDEVVEHELDAFLALLGRLETGGSSVADDKVFEEYADQIAVWAGRRASADKSRVYVAGQGPTPSEIADIQATLKAAVGACRLLWESICRINDAFEEMSNNLYASLFSRDRFNSLDAKHHPVKWLKRWLEGRVISPILLEDDIESLNENLKRLSFLTVASELLRAVAILPDEADDIDLIGMILMREEFHSAQGSRLARPNASVYFNLGAAYYLSAWHYTPDKASIIKSFEEVFDEGFQERRKVAMRYLKRLLPDLETPRLKKLPAKFAIDDARLNRLVIIIETGQMPRFYDPFLDREIWADGPRGGPLVAVRRLFRRF
jgi:hypothetical protein